MIENDKWFVIVNPASGQGKGRKHWNTIQKLLKKLDIPYDYQLTTQQNDATAFARDAIIQGYKKIITAGGDGTVNEVINGIFSQQAVPTSEITFAIIPVGTGNDWIKTHQIPNDYKKAILLIKSGKTILHDVGKVDYKTLEGEDAHRYFINVAGLGYDAYVTKASLERSRWMGNKLFYSYLIIRCLLEYRSTQMKVDYDDKTVEGNIFSMAVGIGRYNGGGAQFVPQAIPDDGLFAVSLFKDIKSIDVVRNFRKFYQGTIIEHPKVIGEQAREIYVSPPNDSKTWIEADGEFLGTLPAKFIMLERCIKVIVP